MYFFFLWNICCWKMKIANCSPANLPLTTQSWRQVLQSGKTIFLSHSSLCLCLCLCLFQKTGFTSSCFWASFIWSVSNSIFFVLLPCFPFLFFTLFFFTSILVRCGYAARYRWQAAGGVFAWNQVESRRGSCGWLVFGQTPCEDSWIMKVYWQLVE